MMELATDRPQAILQNSLNVRLCWVSVAYDHHHKPWVSLSEYVFDKVSLCNPDQSQTLGLALSQSARCSLLKSWIKGVPTEPHPTEIF